jgi:hypothetical protein
MTSVYRLEGTEASPCRGVRIYPSLHSKSVGLVAGRNSRAGHGEASVPYEPTNIYAGTA